MHAKYSLSYIVVMKQPSILYGHQPFFFLFNTGLCAYEYMYYRVSFFSCDLRVVVGWVPTNSLNGRAKHCPVKADVDSLHSDVSKAIVLNSDACEAINVSYGLLYLLFLNSHPYRMEHPYKLGLPQSTLNTPLSLGWKLNG